MPTFECIQKLTGKWGKVILQVFIYFISTFIISGVLRLFPNIVSIISIIIAVPLSYGLLISIFKIIDDDKFSYIDFFTNGFSNFSKAWDVMLQIFLKLFLPILLLITAITMSLVGIFQSNELFLNLGAILEIIAGIYFVIKELSYSLSFYILYTQPSLTAREAVTKSAELMRGNVYIKYKMTSYMKVLL